MKKKLLISLLLYSCALYSTKFKVTNHKNTEAVFLVKHLHGCGESTYRVPGHAVDYPFRTSRYRIDNAECCVESISYYVWNTAYDVPELQLLANETTLKSRSGDNCDGTFNITVPAEDWKMPTIRGD